MKTFASLAALLAVTNGFASAGPVAVGDGSSKCMAETCGYSTMKFGYKPGHTYAYKYATKIETALEQTSGDKSTIHMDADVSLHVIDFCRFVLKINSVKLDEEMTGSQRRASKGTEQLAERLMKNPLTFNFGNGVISKLCPALEESKTALNIKRGILSMIQNSMADLHQTDIAFEDDVVGHCRTEYSWKKGYGNGVTILKKKVLSECKRHGEQQVLNALALPRVVSKSSSMINGTQQCEQTVNNEGLLHKVECSERHVVRPFSRQEKGAATEIYQTLQHVGTSSQQETMKWNYPEGDVQGLTFSSVGTELEREGFEHSEMLLRKLAEKGDMDVGMTNELYSKLVDSLRRMEYSSLLRLRSKFENNKRFINALTETMTHDALQMTAELVRSGDISIEDAKLWLLKIALATNVDASTIPNLSGLLDKRGLEMEANLAVSAFARTYLQENPSTMPGEIRSLVEKLYSQLNEQTSEHKLMATIKAIGNLGLSNGQEQEIIRAASHKSIETRVAAMEAFRRFPCENREPLMDVFRNTAEIDEVRVAAYLSSCPSKEMIASVKQVLLAENQGSQLASFVYSHVKNLAKRSSVSVDVSPITADEKLKILESNSTMFSKNYFYEMFFNPLDVGFEVDAGTLMTRDSNTVMLNATFDIFGYAVNLFDARAKMHSEMTSLETLVRFFGKEVFYKQLGGEDRQAMKLMLDSIMSPAGWKFNRSMVILDSKLVVPTGNGFPLSVAVNATSTVAMNLKASPRNIVEGTKVISEARAAPSVTVRFGVSMMVDLPKTKSGIKMVATASSQWDIGARLEFDVTEALSVGSIKIGVPKKQSDLIEVESNVYLVGADLEQGLVSANTRPQHMNWCTETGLDIFSQKFCVELAYPKAKGNAPFVLLRGPTKFAVNLVKTDETANELELSAESINIPNGLRLMSVDFKLPGSKTKRHFGLKMFNDLSKREFGLELDSPVKEFALKGSYDLESDEKRVRVWGGYDGNNNDINIVASMKTVDGKFKIFSPKLQLELRNELVLSMKSEVAVKGGRNFNGEIEISSIFNQGAPIRVHGDYSETSEAKGLNIGLDSKLMKSTLAAELHQRNGNFKGKLEGDFKLEQGEKHTFALGTSLTEENGYVSAEGRFEMDGQEMVRGSGKMVRKTPMDFEVALDYLNGQYGAKMTLTTVDHLRQLNAAVVLDHQKYDSRFRFGMQRPLATIDGKVVLPNGSEKSIAIQYDAYSPIKRLSLATDLFGSSDSAQFSFQPTEDSLKLNGLVKINGEKMQGSALLARDPEYRMKLDLSHNGRKVLASTMTASKDYLRNPALKAKITYRQNVLLDVAADAVLVLNRPSVSLALRAPLDLNVNMGYKRFGALTDVLKLEGDFRVSNEDRSIDFGLVSSGELSLYQNSKKLNLEATMTLPRSAPKRVSFKNMLDSSTWMLDWQYQPATNVNRMHRMTTSGLYSMHNGKFDLRGMFEADIELNGVRFVMEPIKFDNEFRASHDELGFRSEFSRDAKTILMVVAFDIGRKQQSRYLSGELNIGGSPYHIHWTLDGIDLESGWRTTFDGKWREETLTGKSTLMANSAKAKISAELHSTFKPLSKAKISLQVDGQKSNNKLMNVQYVYGEHFAKAEMSLGDSTFEANVQSSLADWNSMSAKAAWKIEPKLHLTLQLTAPKYPNNLFELEHDWSESQRQTGSLSIAVPSMYQGNLVDAKLNYVSGDTKLIVLYRGQELAKFVSSYSSMNMDQEFIAALTYQLNGEMKTMNLDTKIQRHQGKSLELKTTLLQDSQAVFEFEMDAVLPFMHGTDYYDMRCSQKVSIDTPWGPFYAMKNFSVAPTHARLQYDLGRSVGQISRSLDVLVNWFGNTDALTFETKAHGQWLDLNGSLSAKGKLTKEDGSFFRVKVAADSKPLFSSVWQHKKGGFSQQEFDGSWELPQLEHNGKLQLSYAVENGNTLEVKANLDRDGVAEKATELSMRLAVEEKDFETALKVKLPEELGSRAFRGNMKLEPSAFHADMEVVVDEHHTYSAEASSNWERGLTMTCTLKQNNRSVAKADLTASLTGLESQELALTLTHRDAKYAFKFSGAILAQRGEFELEATSNQWQQKHTARTEYSTASRTAQLKIDIAELKINVDAAATGSLALNGETSFKNGNIGNFRIFFNPAGMEGSLHASWDGKRVATGYAMKLSDGHIKFELPSGSTKLEWINTSNELAMLKGHWSFQGDEWRFEISTEPQFPANTDAKLFFAGNEVGHLTTRWTLQQVTFDFRLAFGNVELWTKFALERREGSVSGIFKMNCPWISRELIDAMFKVGVTPANFNIQAEANVDSRIHSVDVTGSFKDGAITGLVKTRCPIYGDMEARLTGTYDQERFEFTYSSDKLRENIVVSGKFMPEEISYEVKSEGFAVSGKVFRGTKYGIELHSDNELTYEIAAVVDRYDSFEVSCQTPWIPKTGAVVKRNGSDFDFEVTWFSRELIKGTLRKNSETLYELSAVVEFPRVPNDKHSVVITVDFNHPKRVTVNIDGKSFVFDFAIGQEHLALEMNHKGSLMIFSIKREQHTWLHRVELSANGPAYEHKLQLHQNLFGSMASVRINDRTFSANLKKLEAALGEKIVARFAWDDNRNPRKAMEVTVKRQGSEIKSLTVTLPETREPMEIKIAQTAGNLELRTVGSPQSMLVVSNEGMIKMRLGHVIVEGEMSGRKSGLVVRHLGSDEDHVNIGYDIREQTFSGRFLWTPRFSSYDEMTLKNIMNELQLGQYQAYVEAEGLAIRKDLESMWRKVEDLHRQDSFYMKSLLKPIAEMTAFAEERMQRVYERVENNYSTFTRSLNKYVSRYGERLAVAKTLIKSIVGEVVEDVMDAAERSLLKFGEMVNCETFKNLLEWAIKTVRDEQDLLGDTFNYVVDTYVCEFSQDNSHIENRSCGFGYQLESSKKQQQGFAVRLPLLMTMSS